MTGAYIALRVCERFGLQPFSGKASWDELDSGEQRTLLDYERIRGEEEARAIG